MKNNVFLEHNVLQEKKIITTLVMRARRRKVLFVGKCKYNAVRLALCIKLEKQKNTKKNSLRKPFNQQRSKVLRLLKGYDTCNKRVTYID